MSRLPRSRNTCSSLISVIVSLRTKPCGAKRNYAKLGAISYGSGFGAGAEHVLWMGALDVHSGLKLTGLVGYLVREKSCLQSIIGCPLTSLGLNLSISVTGEGLCSQFAA